LPGFSQSLPFSCKARFKGSDRFYSTQSKVRVTAFFHR